MKVCMLTSTHKPFDIRVFHKESRSLAKFHEVTIIAPDEKKWKKIIDNVRIIAVKKPESKILHLVTLWRVFKEGLKQDCDVYHCHEPDSLMVGLILKILKRNKVKIIYDVHEHWPSEIAYGWLKIKKRLLRIIIEGISHMFELTLLKYADSVIAVSHSVSERFCRIRQVVIIPNVPVVELISFKNFNYNVDDDCDFVQMGGGIKSYHGIYEILNALKKVKKRYPKVKIKFVGAVKEDVDEVFNGLKENIIFAGYLPIEKMYEEISKCKVGFTILKSEFYNAYIGLPNKVFDYMVCGLAVIGSDYPEIRKIIKTARCGILVNPDNIEEIANAIIYLLENPAEAKKMGIRGRKFVEREMSWEKMEERLLKIYEQI